MRVTTKISVAFLFFFLFSSLKAQQPTVKATIDSLAILVGEQTNIHLEVTRAKGNIISFPVFSDTIIAGIELIDVGKIDTTELDDKLDILRLKYTITGFDEGLYYIPPFSVAANTDTFFSNSLSLKISAFQVDTVSKQFYDIKSVMEPDFVLADYAFILLIIWLVSLILGILIYFILFKKKKVKLIKKQEKIIPSYSKAFAELKALKVKNLWQQGKVKTYYTELTDILRIYLQERFGINAIEMTSDEILHAFNVLEEKESAYGNLKQILILSDFVKFAKFIPQPDENELSYINAHLFVSQTQPEEAIQKNTIKSDDNQKDTDQQSVCRK